MNTPLRILLVEDHATTNMTLTRLLSADYTVFSAINAAKALELARSQAFDLALVDIGLPDKDGWELMREIHTMQPEIQAIALTGVDYTEDPHRFSEAGFDMHIPKPAELSKIVSAINTLFPDRE